MMKQKREINLDLIRAVAAAMVVSVHFFLHCGYYETPLLGLPMITATLLRTLLMSCVPLFLLLTGYLRAGKQWSPGYYRRLGSLLLTYLLCSLVCLAFRTFYLGEGLTAMDWLRGIFHFEGAPYGWYVEMYIGLFLLAPFLNAMWSALTEAGKWALLLSVTVLTFLPSLGNMLFHTRLGLAPFPDWWRNLYPVGYYLIGVALRQRPLKLKWQLSWLLSVLVSLAGGALHIWGNWGKTVVYFEPTYWDGFFTAVSAVLLFSAMTQLPLGRCPAWVKRGITGVAEVSFALYLVSYVADVLLAGYLTQLVPAAEERLGWFMVLVPLSLLLSAVLARLVMTLQRGLTALLPGRRENTQ